MEITRMGAKSLCALIFLASVFLGSRALAQGIPSPQPSAVPEEVDESSPSTQPPVESGFDDPQFLAQRTTPVLPDSPGWTLPAPSKPMLPCPTPTNPTAARAAVADAKASATPLSQQPCIQINPFQRFLDSTSAIPLTPREKAYLAFHNLKDLGNLITIVGTAAFTVGVDSHTAYGPGFKGFARNTGYSFSQDATGEFFGTFLIPSLLHEDPHYHREPKSPVQRRIFHAISRTVVAQHDDGRMMPNYATLLTYPISAELSNLYVPGVNVNAASTAKRIATGLATDPIGNIITEFLPDFAKRLNIRVIFVQRILNSVTAGASGGAGAAP